MDPLPKRIEEWAKKNELQIVSAERRRFFVGPFSFQKNAGHVYRIVVRGRDGEVGEGWLSLQNSLFGADWEEVKWIRRPAHTMEPRPEDVVAQKVLGVGTMSQNASKWGIGVLISVSFIAWGLASLAYGRFVIPSRRSIVFEGIPGSLIALAAISFGLSSHLRLFWGIDPKQTKALLLAAFVCLLLGLCVQLFEFLIGLPA